MKLPKVIVTGCPRSGTMYVSALLRKLGVRVGHEAFCAGEQGMVAWWWPIHGAHSRWMPSPSWDINTTPQVRLHQVRHPLKVINSMGHITTWDRIGKYIDVGTNRNTGRRRMLMALNWNKLCEQFVGPDSHRYRIEQLPDIFDEFCSWVGCEPNRGAFARVQHRNKRDPNREYNDYTWDDLSEIDAELCEQVKEMGRRYGYDI